MALNPKTGKVRIVRSIHAAKVMKLRLEGSDEVHRRVLAVLTFLDAR